MSAFVAPVSVAEVGRLVGDPARANMLAALMGGEALTAGELARHAHVSPQTASGHLAKLAEAGLLALARQGRHRYYRLASPLVGQMLEGMMAVAAFQAPPRYRPQSPIDEAMRNARTCYDHLAGRLGVAIADAMTEKGLIELDDDGGVATEMGRKFLGTFGIDTALPTHGRRRFLRPCLDWSERRWHVAGVLGERIATHCLDLGWIKRLPDTRAVAVTAKGREGLRSTFGIDLKTAAR